VARFSGMQTIGMLEVSPLMDQSLKAAGVTCTCYCNDLPNGEGFATMIKDMLASSHPLTRDVLENDAVAALCYRDETEYVVAFAMLYATFNKEDSVCFLVQYYGGEPRFLVESPRVSIVSSVQRFVSYLVDNNPFIARVVAEVPGTEYQIAWVVHAESTPPGFKDSLLCSGYEYPNADDLYPYHVPCSSVYVNYFWDDTYSSPSASPNNSVSRGPDAPLSYAESDASAHSSDEDSGSDVDTHSCKVARVA
jgi:hypothetical protein